jgi:hypothetical protein
MRLPARRAIAVICGFVVLLAACDRAEQRTTLVEPQLAARSSACDFGRMANDARSYFPGNGRGSEATAVLDLIDLMKSDCSAGDAEAYTVHWFDVAAIVGDVLAAGTGGNASTGASFLAASLMVRGPDGQAPIFDPCGDGDDCLSWEGYPALPDFEAVLSSPHGAWAVVSTGTAAVCSSFEHPCSDWSAALLGDAWGVEPSVSWEAALFGRTTVVFGNPLPGPSPTGEALLDTALPAYLWLLIPAPGTFGVDQSPPAVLEVGLCSTAEPTRIETLVQKGGTVLTEAVIDWCTDQVPSIAGRGSSLWDRALAFLSPAPAPLVATTAMASRGPGGSASSFTDFYAIDVPRAAVVAFSAKPADGVVGQPILGVDGEPFRIRTFTSSEETPLENAHVTITVIGNGGLIPSGNDVSGAGLSCSNFVCSASTQADHESRPGELDLPLVFTKTGQYSLCVEANLSPLSFGGAVCTEKFNIRP